MLLYNKTVDGVEGALWLASQTLNILCYLPLSNLGKKWCPGFHPWQGKKSSKLNFLWCIYTRVPVYVVLLCIPISFFIWSIVGQTRHIICMGMKRASKWNLHIVKTSCQWMKAIIFQVFDHFANSPTNYHFFNTSLTLSYEKWEEN